MYLVWNRNKLSDNDSFLHLFIRASVMLDFINLLPPSPTPLTSPFFCRNRLNQTFALSTYIYNKYPIESLGRSLHPFLQGDLSSFYRAFSLPFQPAGRLYLNRNPSYRRP